MTSYPPQAVEAYMAHALVLVLRHLRVLLGRVGVAVQTGSREIPPDAMQFLFTVGTVLVGLVLLIARRGALENSPRGISCGLLNEILSGLGGLTLFAAYHTNGNTTLITATTALYPMITVVLAIAILRERFRPIQAVGLLFAAVAIVIFSL